MDRPGVRQVPEGRREQRKIKEAGCKINCGTLTTLAVEGLMMMIMTMVVVLVSSMGVRVHCTLHIILNFNEYRSMLSIHSLRIWNEQPKNHTEKQQQKKQTLQAPISGILPPRRKNAEKRGLQFMQYLLQCAGILEPWRASLSVVVTPRSVTHHDYSS